MGRYASRKLFVFLLGYIVGMTMAFFGKLTADVSTFISTMTAIYLAGNVANGVKNIFYDKLNGSGKLQ